MGCSQRRIGPFNLGWYGILGSLINGCNLCISQFHVIKFLIDFLLQVFLIIFFIISFWQVIILYPNFIIDIYYGIILILLLTGISLLFIYFSVFSSFSKYSILGSIRIISQFISFELMFTTILLILILSYNFNDLSIASMLFTEYFYLYFLVFYSEYFFIYSEFLFILHFNPIFLLFFFVSVLGESNRVPFDLLEAESELVAGFITEYSSIYFSLILLTEYGSIIVMSFWMIILFSIIPWSLIWFLLIVCLIRSTLNRLKFDELMTNAWIIILALLFSWLFYIFLIP